MTQRRGYAFLCIFLVVKCDVNPKCQDFDLHEPLGISGILGSLAGYEWMLSK